MSNSTNASGGPNLHASVTLDISEFKGSVAELKRLTAGMSTAMDAVRKAVGGESATALEALGKSLKSGIGGINEVVGDMLKTLTKQLKDAARGADGAGELVGKGFSTGIKKALNSDNLEVVAAARFLADSSVKSVAAGLRSGDAEIKASAQVLKASVTNALKEVRAAANLESLLVGSGVGVAGGGRSAVAKLAGEYDLLTLSMKSFAPTAAETAAATARLFNTGEGVAGGGRSAVAKLAGEYDLLTLSMKSYTTTAEKAAAASRLASSAALGVGSGVAGSPTVTRQVTASSGYDSVMNVTRTTVEATKANTALAGSTSTATDAARKLREEQKQLNHIMHEGHSAARGLAQGFGAMVFTYGSIVPLLAGAAISNTIVQTVKEGAALERHLTFVSQLTDGAAISVGMFEQAMRGSQVAVKDGAEGLRALAQSGFDSQQALIALPEILKLATVGELSVGQAALTATGIMHAFNLELGDLPHIVDVLAKSAAESNTSVASMMESLKTASVGADQFGVSLEEMSGALEILGKRNITGTAAGTALKNMMTELSSPTDKAAKRMEQLGFSAYDATGKLKSFETQLEELRNKMVNLDEQSRNTVLTDLFNERGRRGAAALLKDFDDLQVRIERLRTGADGFASTVNQALGVTVSGQVKTLANDFQVILGGAFERTSDAWSNLVADLAGFVKSTGFRDAITAVSTGVIFLAENIGTLTATLAAGAMGFRLYALGMAGVTAASALLVGGTEAAAVATTALSTALSRVFWPVAIVGALAAAYLTLRDGVDEAAEAHKRLLREGEDLVASQAKSIRDTLESGRAFEEAARSGRKYADVLAEIRNGTKNADLSDASEKNFEAARAEYLKLKALMGDAENGAATSAVRVAQQRMVQAANEMAKVRSVIAEGEAVSDALKAHKADTALKAEKESLANGTKALILEVASRRSIVEGYADKSQAVYDKLTDVWNRSREIDPSDIAGVARLKVEFSEAQKAVQALSTSVGSLKDDKGSTASTKVLDHTKELTAQINLLKLEQMNADKEFANVDSMNKRNQALRGYATEAEIAATYMQALSKIESQYTIDAINAEKAVVSAEDSLKKLRGASKPDASAIAEAERMLELAWGTYEATMGELDAKEGIAKVAAGLAKTDTERAAAAKLVLDKVNKEKVSRDLIETQYQNQIKLEKAQNDLDLIGKDLTVAQLAEMERLTAVEAANHEFSVAAKEAEIALQVRLNELVATGATDLEYAAESAGSKYVAAYQEALQKRNTAIASADIAAVTKVRAEYQKTFDRIESGLTDALMKGGKEGARGVRELLVQELFSKPFQMVVQALISPVTGAITNAVMGSATGGAAGSGSLLSIGSNLWNLAKDPSSMSVSAGFNSLASTSFGQSMGWSSATPTGYTTGSGASYLTESGNSMASGLETAASVVGYLSAFASASEGKWGKAAGEAIGTYILPGVGTVVGSFLGGVVDDLFGGGGGPKTESSYGTANAIGDTSKTGAMGQYVSSIESSWDSIASTLGLTEDLIASAFVSIDSMGDDLTNFNAVATLAGRTVSDRVARTGSMDAAQVGRSEEELQAAMENEMTRILFEALQASDLPAQYSDYLNTVEAGFTPTTTEADQISAMVTAMENVVVIHDFQAALENLPFEYLADLGFNAAKGLIEAAGGLDKLGANLSGFYENFYSADEKTALLTANTTKAIEKLGGVMPAVDTNLRSVYRAEVERLGAMDLSVAANAAAYTGLLALQGAFDSLAGGAEAAAEALAETNQGWQDQMDVLTGKTTEREIALRNVTDATTRSLMRQVWAQEDLKSATDSTVESYNNIMNAAADIRATVAGVGTSVSDSIFGMQYGLEDNAGKYNMLDVKGARLEDQMFASSDIYAIAKLAQDQISLINQAWSLLDPEQQKTQLVPFENKLNEISDYVMQRGADPVALAKAQAADTAKTIAEAVKAAIAEAMADPTSTLYKAAQAVQAAANTPVQANVTVTVTAPAGSEVSVA